MTKTRADLDWKRSPQYLDKCGNCSHTNAFHLSRCNDKGEDEPNGIYLSGRSCPCWTEGCDCTTFLSTWAQW